MLQGTALGFSMTVPLCEGCEMLCSPCGLLDGAKSPA